MEATKAGCALNTSSLKILYRKTVTVTANASTATSNGQQVAVNFDKAYSRAVLVMTASNNINVDWVTVEAYLATSSSATLIVRNRYAGAIMGTITVLVIGT